MPDKKRTKNASTSSCAASRASTSPIARVRASVSARALAEGCQPSSRAATRMRSRVSGETPGRSLTANETAAADTPARRATSAMVGRRRVVSGRRSGVVVSLPGDGERVAYLKRFRGTGGTMRHALCLGMALAALSTTAEQAADEASTSDRLQDRREVAAGTRAYSIGFEDGG